MCIGHRRGHFDRGAVVKVPIAQSVGQLVESLCIDLLVGVEEVESCRSLDALSRPVRNEVEVIEVLFYDASIDNHSSVWIHCLSPLRSVEPCIALVVAGEEYDLHSRVLFVNLFFHQLDFSGEHEV